MNDGYATDQKASDQLDARLEQWRPIPGYEGIYDASNFGRIRSTPGKTTSSARSPIRVWSTRILKPKRQLNRRRSDARVELWKDGQHRTYLVSRLVASAWLGTPENDMTINHINGDWNDNKVENLEWITLDENIRKGFATGCFAANQHHTVLEDQDGVQYDFASASEASRFLGRSTGYIYDAVKHRYQISSSDGIKYRLVSKGKECSE